MANRRRKPGSTGRVTPKGNPPPARPAGPDRTAKRRFDPDRPVQVGRRPSNPGFLLAVGVLWIAAGVVAIVSLSAGWKLVPGIAFIGIGLFFVRGAGATALRRARARPDQAP